MSNPDFNFEHFQSRMAFHRRTGSIPTAIHHQSAYSFDPGSNKNSSEDERPPHHHHQVLYVCRGHCSGPQCDFSKSLKQWHSTVWLEDGGGHSSATKSEVVPFQSQVVASAPKALEKLDQKRENLRNLKSVLAQKLERKQKNKELQKKLAGKEQRSASAMNFRRTTDYDSSRPNSRLHEGQERSASAMTVLKPSNNQGTNLMF